MNWFLVLVSRNFAYTVHTNRQHPILLEEWFVLCDEQFGQVEANGPTFFTRAKHNILIIF